MSRPPRARENVLDAFEQILREQGERAATVKAVAAAAGVSKGGLLYHFPSKEALEHALVDRLTALVAADVDAIATAPEGPIAFFLRTSVVRDTPLNRVLVAASRLAQNGHAVAGAELRRVREKWEEALRPHTRDSTTLALVMLVGDGLYYHGALDMQVVPAPALSSSEFADLVGLVEGVTRDE